MHNHIATTIIICLQTLFHTQNPSPTQDLIVKHDISAQIAQFAAEAAASDRGLATYTFPDGTWSIYDLPSLLTSCLSLTRTAVNCERLVQHGLLPTLLCVLRAANAAAAAAKAAAAPAGAAASAAAEPDAGGVGDGGEKGSSSGLGGCSRNVDPALGVVAARTLFNLAQVSALHPALKEAGVQELLKVGVEFKMGVVCLGVVVLIPIP